MPAAVDHEVLLEVEVPKGHVGAVWGHAGRRPRQLVRADVVLRQRAVRNLVTPQKRACKMGGQQLLCTTEIALKSFFRGPKDIALRILH